jgi:hypothetical protein
MRRVLRLQYLNIWTGQLGASRNKRNKVFRKAISNIADNRNRTPKPVQSHPRRTELSPLYCSGTFASRRFIARTPLKTKPVPIISAPQSKKFMLIPRYFLYASTSSRTIFTCVLPEASTGWAAVKILTTSSRKVSRSSVGKQSV